MKTLREIEFHNIIVRMPNWIGDMVMAIPVLIDLRKKYPHARITAMCRRPLSDLLQGNPLVDEVFDFNKKESKKIKQLLRKGNYDLGVLLTNSISSAYWFWRGKVKTRLGFNCQGRRLFLTHPVPVPEFKERQHLIYTYKMVLDPLGIPLTKTGPSLLLEEKEIEDARAFLKNLGVSKEQCLIGIHPGATYGSAKCWLPERFKEVAEKLLQDPHIVVVFIGDKTVIPLIDEICTGLKGTVINLAGKTTLREIAALITLFDVLLTNDSGPMHIADALGIKTVALFGSTNDVVTGPFKNGKVIHKHVACSPCYKRTCPIDFRCMKGIESDEVYDALLEAVNLKQKSKLHVMV